MHPVLLAPPLDSLACADEQADQIFSLYLGLFEPLSTLCPYGNAVVSQKLLSHCDNVFFGSRADFEKIPVFHNGWIRFLKAEISSLSYVFRKTEVDYCFNFMFS